MSIAPSWTEQRSALHDLRCLLRFRISGLGRRSRRRLLLGALLLVGLTATAVAVPAWLGQAATGGQRTDVMLLLPTGYLALLVLNTVGATANGGGRELVPRDQAVAFPVSTTTEHLGALVCAPLNIGWILQSWLLLGATAYAFGPDHLLSALAPVLAWILMATALAQALAWLVEGVRRGRHGVLVVRAVSLVLLLLLAAAVVAGALTSGLDRSPTRRVLLVSLAAADGQWGRWLLGLVLLAVGTVLSVWLGATAARWSLRRPEREELRLESGRRVPRALPGTRHVMLLRLDRASVWRSVPLRRGIVVLALTPALVAAAGRLEWSMITVLPGLVVSGAALLFAVNAWCLDGRGTLWRQSLPVSPHVQFWVRSVVVAEVMLGAAAVTVAVAGVRAGSPSASELVAVLAAVVSICAHVTAVAMRWSAERPYAVDLRSARATPAPPVVMLGYSARLALTTTVIGLVFGGLAGTGAWWASALLGVSITCLAGVRLVRESEAWADPHRRVAVVAAVAG